MLCWAWHALFSPTCTYFYVGVLNASCASLGLQVHIEESFKIKGEYRSCLFVSVLVLWGTGRDGKDKN